MRPDDINYWEKVRALCCAAWGKAPWEFDAAWDAGLITTTNVKRQIDLALVNSPNPEVLEEFLYPGTIEARKEAEAERKFADSWAGLLQLREKEKNGG